MLKFEHTEVVGWEAAIRGMRNPLESWEKSDSGFCETQGEDCTDCAALDENGRCTASIPIGDDDLYFVGKNDLDLMTRLRNAGTDHRKFMRMLVVYVDITGPLYWWKEFKTYRAGRKFGDDEPDILQIPEDYFEFDIEMNSCSTMHKIHAKEFTLEDFSTEHLSEHSLEHLKKTIELLNFYRADYINPEIDGQPENRKFYWWQMIQLLPSSYNQTRTVMLNYEVLANIYKSRKNHKLDEWSVQFMEWIERLPYSELITGKG